MISLPCIEPEFNYHVHINPPLDLDWVK